MNFTPIKAVALALSLLVVESVAEDQKAEPKDKPSAQAKPAAGPDRDGVSIRDLQEIARLSVAVAKNEENPRTKATLEALDQPFSLQLDDDATLGDLVNQIKESLTTADDKKVPVYVDPRGIEEAGATLDSPVDIDLVDVPLKLSLRLALKQLALAYCVREGVIIISSLDGVLMELKEAEGELMGLHPDRVLMGPGGPSFMGITGGRFQ